MRVIVIGGGAAGFFGAIQAAHANPHLQVTLLEAAAEPLGKVKISGGGRCNVTHHCFEPVELISHYPRGGKALRGPFSRFQPRDTVDWFAQHGVKLKTEADGRMFPVTDRSQTIIDCLRQAAMATGVKLQTRCPVKSLRLSGSEFSVQTRSAGTLKARSVLLATGSSRLGYRWAESLGHRLRSPVPSLFTFNIRDSRLKDLAGLSVQKAQVQLLSPGKHRLIQSGPVLIAHWGLTGPAVLKLSAWGARLLQEANYRLPLQINWLPDYAEADLRDRLKSMRTETPKKRVVSLAPVPIPRRLWQRLCQFVEIPEETAWSALSKKHLNQLITELRQGQYQIQGKGIFKEEFVTCGGVDLKAVNFKTMESRCCRGLYFAGEILDIDGVTGGFNFQNAWTTGWIAGNAIAAAAPITPS
ncbi:MAG: NAD(P)/FAD-dependent oxidoreductase [Cyanobacteria bacterium P01_H01_bin.15]